MPTTLVVVVVSIKIIAIGMPSHARGRVDIRAACSALIVAARIKVRIASIGTAITAIVALESCRNAGRADEPLVRQDIRLRIAVRFQ